MSESTTVRIAGRPIGPGHPAYIVAELSANHNGELARAVETIRAFARAGADAIKLQTYTADTITIKSSAPEFTIGGSSPWAGRTLHDLYQEAHTPWEWHEQLFSVAREEGVAMFSSPFDDTAVDLLERLHAPAYKIASFEMVDDGLLRRVASTGKPVVLSTGMATLAEVQHAIAVLRTAGANELIVLRCTSAYPAPDASMSLATIAHLAETSGAVVGLSDHSMGTTAAVVAVTLGASFIEKHVTLRRSDGGVDSHFSLEPAEFRQLVDDVRRAQVMIGEPTFGAGLAEEGNIVFRRSLYIVADVQAGEQFTRQNVRSIRPGHGLSPQHLDAVLGQRASRPVKRGTPVTWDLVTQG